MTLQEAIKSGKNFKRPFHKAYYDHINDDPDVGDNRFFSYQDIIAVDWITEEDRMSEEILDDLIAECKRSRNDFFLNILLEFKETRRMLSLWENRSSHLHQDERCKRCNFFIYYHSCPTESDFD